MRQEEGSGSGARCQEGELVLGPSPGSRLWGAPVLVSRAGPQGCPGDGQWVGWSAVLRWVYVLSPATCFLTFFSQRIKFTLNLTSTLTASQGD